MIVHTIAILHAQIAGIEIAIATKNLVETTEDTPRLPMARTTRVDITPIMWTRATRGHVRTLAALNPPSRKSREFECPLLQGLVLIVPVPQVMMRKIITLDSEYPQARMTQASAHTNPLLQPPHMVSALTMLSLPPQQTTMMVGQESPLLNARCLQRIDRHWNGHNKCTTSSCHMKIGIANKKMVGTSRLHANLDR